MYLGIGLSAELVCLLWVLQVLRIFEGCVEVVPRLRGAGRLLGESSSQTFPELVPARRCVVLGRVLVFAREMGDYCPSSNHVVDLSRQSS